MKLRIAHVLGLLAAVAALALAIYQFKLGGGAPAPAGAAPPSSAQDLALGAKVYQAHCASCHGAQLEGQPNWRERGANGLLPAPPHDASGHTWHHADEVLFRITKYGVVATAGLKDYVSAMPIYEGVLSDTEIRATLAWIKSQWPDSIRAKHDQINAQHKPAGP